MKSGFLLLALFTFASAMVPRTRRALNSEELIRSMGVSTSTTAKPKEICAPQTPCAWSTYRPGEAKIIELSITNSYCICSTETVCQINEDDSSVNAFIHRCRPPYENDEASDEGAQS